VDRFGHCPPRRLLGHRVLVATGPLARLLGLAHLDREEAPSALLIPRCRCVHTFGMRFALDLYFLDGEGDVVEARLGVPPRRLAFCARAHAVLELAAGKGGEFGAPAP
jgi:uncharacterized membrane protein (UPF0127 family)